MWQVKCVSINIITFIKHLEAENGSGSSINVVDVSCISYSIHGSSEDASESCRNNNINFCHFSIPLFQRKPFGSLKNKHNFLKQAAGMSMRMHAHVLHQFNFLFMDYAQIMQYAWGSTDRLWVNGWSIFAAKSQQWQIDNFQWVEFITSTHSGLFEKGAVLKTSLPPPTVSANFLPLVHLEYNLLHIKPIIHMRVYMCIYVRYLDGCGRTIYCSTSSLWVSTMEFITYAIILYAHTHTNHPKNFPSI